MNDCPFPCTNSTELAVLNAVPRIIIRLSRRSGLVELISTSTFESSTYVNRVIVGKPDTKSIVLPLGKLKVLDVPRLTRTTTPVASPNPVNIEG